MRSQAGRLARALLLGTLLVAGQVGISNAASPVDTSSQATPAASQILPSGTLTVAPPIIALNVSPGSSASTSLTLHSGILETVTLEADGLGQDADGSFTFVAAGQDTSSYSARSMLSVSPTSVEMQPGAELKITVKATAPQNAGAGTRYAILRITGTPGTGTQNVGIGVELGVPALITMADTSATHAGVVDGLGVDTTSGPSLVVNGKIKNTGNTHYGAAPNQITASATLYDSSNKQIAESRTVLAGNSIIPTFSRAFKVTLASAKNLGAGHYRVEVSGRLQDGTLLGTAALQFDISNGAVEGATFVAVQSSDPSGSGSTGGLLLLVALCGVLGGAMLTGVVMLWTRRKAIQAAP